MGTVSRDVVLVHEIFGSGSSLPRAQTNHFNSDTWVLPHGYHAAMLVSHGRSGLFWRLLWCTPKDQVTASSSNLNAVCISEEPETQGPHRRHLTITPHCRYVQCDVPQPQQHYSMSSLRFRELQKGGQRLAMSVIPVHSRSLLVWLPVFYKSSVLPVFLNATRFVFHQWGIKQTIFSDKMYDKIHGGIFIFRRNEAFFQKLLSKPIYWKLHHDFINHTSRIISRGTTKIHYQLFPILCLIYLESGKGILILKCRTGRLPNCL